MKMSNMSGCVKHGCTLCSSCRRPSKYAKYSGWSGYFSGLMKLDRSWLVPTYGIFTPFCVNRIRRASSGDGGCPQGRRPWNAGLLRCAPSDVFGVMRMASDLAVGTTSHNGPTQYQRTLN